MVHTNFHGRRGGFVLCNAFAGGGARPPGGLHWPKLPETRPEVGFHPLITLFYRRTTASVASSRLIRTHPVVRG